MFGNQRGNSIYVLRAQFKFGALFVAAPINSFKHTNTHSKRKSNMQAARCTHTDRPSLHYFVSARTLNTVVSVCASILNCYALCENTLNAH